MKNNKVNESSWLANINSEQWGAELENTSARFHRTIAWVAIIFDPVFAITDYFNSPNDWKTLLVFRIGVSLLTLFTLLLQKKFKLPSFIIAFIPFLLISVQNAYVYKVIDADNLLGQHLNYMALVIGAAMFVLWRWYYSVAIVLISIIATGFFLSSNPFITIDYFIIRGGLLLAVAAVFMVVLIQTRYNLVIKEIKARLALKASNEEITHLNKNLERIVQERTLELQNKNNALEEAAFINAHKLRSPVASILGLVNIIKTMQVNDEVKQVVAHLKQSTENLDAVVATITKVIEREDKGQQNNS